MSSGADVQVFETPAEVAAAGAERFVAAAEAALAERDRFTVVLAGGSTPVAMFKRLAERPPALDWSRIHFFWGDERCVPPDAPDSNYRTAVDAWLHALDLLPDNIHRIAGELPHVAAAAHYEQHLRTYFELGEDDFPRFDLVYLGLGDDGHTASLFPNSPALADRHRLTVPTESPKPPRPRVSLTFAALNHARAIVFMVAGEKKRQALARMCDSAVSVETCPARGVQPSDGTLTILADRAAAR